jgi:hypothetical protein
MVDGLEVNAPVTTKASTVARTGPAAMTAIRMGFVAFWYRELSQLNMLLQQDSQKICIAEYFADMAMKSGGECSAYGGVVVVV